MRSVLLLLLLTWSASAAEINVRDCGAVGDGVADETQAFRMALDHGGTVYVPAGDYLLKRTLDITVPVCMRGEPGSRLLVRSGVFRAKSHDVRFESLRFSQTGPVQFLAVDVPADESRQCERWTWRDCTFDGVPLTLRACRFLAPNGTEILKGSDVVSGIRLESCVFSDIGGAHALGLNAVSDVVVQDCTFRRCGASADAGDTIKVSGGSHDIRIINNLIEDASRDGIDLYDASRVLVSGNVFRRCGVFGLEVKWSSAAAANDVAYHTITDNRFEECGETGCSVSVRGSVCQGNIAIGCKVGFRCNNGSGKMDNESTGTRFIGNISERCENGFVVYAPYIALIGNTATACAAYGLVLKGEYGTAVGNTLFSNKTDVFITSAAQHTLRATGNIGLDNTQATIPPAAED